MPTEPSGSDPYQPGHPLPNAEFGRIKRHGTSLAELARPELRDLVKLSIGQPAPETKGRDLDGLPLNLGDYRGQFVVLSFWGQCGGCRPDMVTVRELLDRFKPLAMLGVFCDDDFAKAREIAQKAEMPWPSFADARSGPISTAWNNSGWPLYDVIDSQRHHPVSQPLRRRTLPCPRQPLRQAAVGNAAERMHRRPGSRSPYPQIASYLDSSQRGFSPWVQEHLEGNQGLGP